MGVALGATLLLTGCSGGSGGSAKVDATQFTSHLNATTAEFRTRTTEIKEAGRRAVTSSDPSKVVSVYESLRDATEDAAKKYHTLTAPKGLDDSYDSFLKGMDDQVKALDDVVSAAKDKDGATLTRALRTYATLLADWATELAQLSPATTTKNG